MPWLMHRLRDYHWPTKLLLAVGVPLGLMYLDWIVSQHWRPIPASIADYAMVFLPVVCFPLLLRGLYTSFVALLEAIETDGFPYRWDIRDPSVNADGWMDAAQVAITAGNLEAATACFAAAAQLDSRRWAAWLHGARSLCLSGRPEDALQALNRALRQMPGEARLHHGKGQLFSQSGHPQEALACYRRALRRDSSNADIWYDRALAHAGAGHIRRAEADYTRATELRPDFYQAFSNRGILRKGAGRLEEARCDLEQALTLNSGDAISHMQLAQVLQEMARPEEAMRSVERAIEINPSFAPAYLTRSQLYHELGQGELANRDLSQAATLDARVAKSIYDVIGESDR